MAIDARRRDIHRIYGIKAQCIDSQIAFPIFCKWQYARQDSLKI